MIEFFLTEQRAVLQNVLVIAICGSALIWGGGPERAVAATWLIVFEAAGLIDYLLTGGETQLLEVDLFVAASDVVAGLIWIGIALYANRNYTLGIAGLQVLAMSSHLARELSEYIAPIAYAVMTIAPGWLQLIVLSAGLVSHVRRKKKFGAYRDWRVVPGGSDGGNGGPFDPDWLSSAEFSWRDKHK